MNDGSASTILVTGSSGLIGSEVCTYFSNLGWAVHGVEPDGPPPGARLGVGAVMRTTAPLLLHIFATFATGGAQVRFVTIANRLGGAFRHAVVAMDGHYEARALLDPALDIRFPEIGVVKGDTLGNLRRFRAALRDLRPDMLVTSNWGSIEWALARIGTGVPHLHMEDAVCWRAGCCYAAPRWWCRPSCWNVWRAWCGGCPPRVCVASRTGSTFHASPRPAYRMMDQW